MQAVVFFFQTINIQSYRFTSEQMQVKLYDSSKMCVYSNTSLVSKKKHLSLTVMLNCKFWPWIFL